MEHNFVLNTLSFPATTKDEGSKLLYSTLKGMLAVTGRDDRLALYCDFEAGLKNVIIAEDYKYSDFCSDLADNNEEDFLLTLLEIDDKTPMLDHVSESDFEMLASTSYFFSDEPYEKSIDILAVAWRLNGILLSLPTTERWRQNSIAFAQYRENQVPSGASYLRNVASEEHGKELRSQREEQQQKTLGQLYPKCTFSDAFLGWVGTLAHDLQARIKDKLELAHAKDFQGGEPLFKTLNNADGMRELRFGAVQGGAVRILFNSLSDGKQAILVGFVKKNDTEGYAEAIKEGTSLLTDIRARTKTSSLPIQTK